jgi:hypothetical protein
MATIGHHQAIIVPTPKSTAYHITMLVAVWLPVPILTAIESS